MNELLAETGGAPVIRLTAPLLIGRMKKIHEGLGGASMLRKVLAAIAKEVKWR